MSTLREIIEQAPPMKPKSAKAERKKLPKLAKAMLTWAVVTDDGIPCFSETSALMAYEEQVVARVRCHFYKGENVKPVLVLPTPTLKSAKARLKIEQMTQEELAEGIAAVDFNRAHEAIESPARWTDHTISPRFKEDYRDTARSILSFLGRSGT